MEDVALGEPVGAFEIERGKNLAGNDCTGNVRRVFGDLLYHTVAQQFAILVP